RRASHTISRVVIRAHRRGAASRAGERTTCWARTEASKLTCLSLMLSVGKALTSVCRYFLACRFTVDVLRAAHAVRAPAPDGVLDAARAINQLQSVQVPQ